MGNLTGKLTPIHDFGTKIGSAARRCVACNFLDKVMVVHPDVAALMWDAISDMMLPLPGLPSGENYRGVTSFQSFLLLWHDETLKWSDQNDYTMWIPVAATAGSFVFVLTQPFTLPAVGIESALVRVDRNPTGLIVGQFVRMDSTPTYTFFKVASVLPATGQVPIISGFIQTVAPLASQLLFLQSYVPYLKGTQLYISSDPSKLLVVTEDAAQTPAVGMVLRAGFIRPPVGGSVLIQLTAIPNVATGTYISVGATPDPGIDIYLITQVDTVNGNITAVRQGVGSSAAAYHFAGENVVEQQYVTVENPSTSVPVVSYFAATLTEVFGFTLTQQNLTGPAAPGTIYPIGQQIFTVDANGAGEVVNTGNQINGRILHVDTLSDYAYIFKHRSIQSVQYVGAEQGTFFIRPVVTDEGLIGDYSFVKVGNDQMFLWGNKGIYRYSGFTQLVPVAQQHFKQLMDELDISKANQIIGYHNEKDYEIWFVYPRKQQLAVPAEGSADVFGGTSLRIFIYNYLENSVTIDDYSTSLGALTAVGRIEVNQDITWAQCIGTWAAHSVPTQDATWSSVGSDTNPSITLLASRLNGPLAYNGIAAKVPTMTMKDARQRYYAAHPEVTPVITDDLLFLNWFNAYWQTNGGFPDFPVLLARNVVEVQIAQAFGYVVGKGISPYWLGGALVGGISYSDQPGLHVFDNDAVGRNGDPIRMMYESVDYDGGDPLAWKYTDTQWFSIQVKSKRSIAMPLLVYIGTKANYDDDIVWQQPIVLMVSGNKNYVTKTNVQAAGRFFRIKLQAATAGLQFRVSQIRILGRLGATY